MKTCVIFCAAGFDGLLEPIGPEDFVIAADGGVKHTQKLGISCNVVLGDFDSLGCIPEGANVFPVEKDDTDSMLAIRRGLEAGFRRFVIYGGLDGPRLDHTVANFQALQFLAEHGAVGYLVGKEYIAGVLRNEQAEFPAAAIGIFSLFCMGADASGVTIRGLRYPLTDGVLSAGFPLGVSNHFMGRPGSVAVRQGSLLMLYDRCNGFPSRREYL